MDARVTSSLPRAPLAWTQTGQRMSDLTTHLGGPSATPVPPGDAFNDGSHVTQVRKTAYLLRVPTARSSDCSNKLTNRLKRFPCAWRTFANRPKPRKDKTVPAFTRAFKGRHGDRDPRLPPGQYDAGRTWPVLTAEATPRIDTSTWTFGVEGLVANPTTWTWEQIHALPESTYQGDIHCVTTWSKLGMTFRGVAVDALLGTAQPLPQAAYVLAWSHTGYATNLPLADVTNGRAWVAWEVDGAPLPREHGGPARLLVPHLYFWKSAKWVAGLRLVDHDEPGFWEKNGYHDRGDPWLEQRYEGD